MASDTDSKENSGRGAQSAPSTENALPTHSDPTNITAEQTESMEPLTEFTVFPKLPPELRHKIIKHALPCSITVLIHSDLGFYVGIFPSLSPSVPQDPSLPAILLSSLYLRNSA
jgi:hypothetical protein